MNKNLKVIKLGPGVEDREAFVIKHYIDAVYPCFEKFKLKIFNRFADLEPSNKLYYIGKCVITITNYAVAIFLSYHIIDNACVIHYFVYLFNFFFHHTDEEGDQITLLTEEDFRIYLDCPNRGNIYLNLIEKVVVVVTARPSTAEVPVAPKPSAPQPSSDAEQEQLVAHPGVVCDSCNGSVRGYRYKCLECVDFDLCMQCEAKMRHPEHTMCRMSRPNSMTNARVAKFLSKTQRKAGRFGEFGNRPHRGHGTPCSAGAGLYRGLGFHDILGELYSGFVQPQAPPHVEAATEAAATVKKAEPKVSAAPSVAAAETDPSAAIEAARHAAEAARFAKKSEEFARSTVDIIGHFAQHFANVMDPFGVQCTGDDKKMEDENVSTEKSPVDSNASSIVAEKPVEDKKEPEVEKMVPAELAEVRAEKQNSSPPEWVLVEDLGNEEDGAASPSSVRSQQEKVTGTIPKQRPQSSPSSSNSSSIRQSEPSFERLSETLKEHIRVEREEKAAVEIDDANVPEHMRKSMNVLSMEVHKK